MSDLATSMLLDKMANRFVNLPDNYLVIDLETSGFSHKHDLVLQIGHCLVINSKVVDNGEVTLNWLNHPAVDPWWLNQRLIETKTHVEFDRETGQPSGRTFPLSYQVIQNGEDPIATLNAYLDMFRQLHNDKMFFVAHNGYNFDGTMLRIAFERYLGQAWELDDWELFDTGMVVKAVQTSLQPWPEESPRDFCRRVNGNRLKGVKHSLDGYCIRHYGLDRKYGIDPVRMHSAGYDCLATHYLFEELKSGAAETQNASNQLLQRPVGFRFDSP